MTAPEVSPDVLVKANALLGALVAGALMENGLPVYIDGDGWCRLRAAKHHGDAVAMLEDPTADWGMPFRPDDADYAAIALLAMAAYLRAKEAGQ